MYRPVDFSKTTGQIYQTALDCGLPVAVWRFPGAREAEIVVSMNQDVNVGPVDLVGGKPGFIFSRFKDNSDRGMFLAADFYSLGRRSFVRDREHGNGKLARSSLVKFTEKLKSYDSLAGPHARPWYQYQGPPERVASTDKATFCRWVTNAVSAIKEGKLSKVVLSQVRECELPKNFHPLALFEKLCSIYRTAFVSLVSVPGVGTWVGATPELLLSLKADTLNTVALAGTRAVRSGQNGWSDGWQEKEIVEQAIVSEFIRECFVAQGIHDFSECKTESVRIGDLLHLKTEFKLDKVSRYQNEVLGRFLKSLHPTPAVCGVPQRVALDYIEKVEDHDREFYAGYLGPVNLDQQSHLYVNLRCLQIHGRSAVLHAGGGITRDSIPEREWVETELKIDALLRFLKPKKSRKVAGDDFASELLCYE